MTILITAPGEYIAESTDEPEVGYRYILEDASCGTSAQNRAFHALIGEYWKSGQHSYDAKTFADFRNMIKRHHGAGFEAYVYAVIKNGKPQILDAKKYEDIPEEVRKDPMLKTMVRGRLKSWSDYTKKERRKTMDNLITEMIEAGVNTKKFTEIMQGMGAIFK